MAQPANAGTAATVWSDLWRTPDQQGQALLDAGQPAQAADRFHDPRHRAYADLQAGRYQDAAKLLAPFTDSQSEYNRGNALAKAGQLQAALAAYDAALKQAPADRDIRHNRDLVERALRQRRQSPQSSSSNGRQGGQSAGSQGQQPQPSAGQRNGSGSQQSGNASQQSGGASQRSGDASHPSSTGGSQSAGGSQTAANSKADSSQSGQSGNTGQPGTQQSGSPQTAGGYDAGTSKETPGQAQRDAAAAAALAREQRQRSGTGNTTHVPGSDQSGTSEGAPKKSGKAPDAGSLLAGGTRAPRQKPESERQLALDQWLRQIPDSPAGLLQRKFLIEHMMRQQDGGNDGESAQ
jgi:Ca-activated chloride channel family protein